MAGLRYGSFPTTADVGLWVRAPTPSGVFEGLGRALFAQMTDPRRVRPLEERLVEVRSTDPGGLLVQYLTKLLLLQQEEGFLGRRIAVRLFGSPPTRLEATVRGEPFDPARHPSRIEVKAVTMHRLEVDLAGGRARVILDI